MKINGVKDWSVDAVIECLTFEDGRQSSDDGPDGRRTERVRRAVTIEKSGTSCRSQRRR